MKRNLTAVLAVFLVCGCASSGVMGETSASFQLRTDIARMITRIEEAEAPNCYHRVLDTKFVSNENQVVREEWIVESCGKKIIYPVKLSPGLRGGTVFTVSSPVR